MFDVRWNGCHFSGKAFCCQLERCHLWLISCEQWTVNSEQCPFICVTCGWCLLWTSFICVSCGSAALLSLLVFLLCFTVFFRVSFNSQLRWISLLISTASCVTLSKNHHEILGFWGICGMSSSMYHYTAISHFVKCLFVHLDSQNIHYDIFAPLTKAWHLHVGCQHLYPGRVGRVK